MDCALNAPVATEDLRPLACRWLAGLALLLAGVAAAHALYTVPTPGTHPSSVLLICGEWLMGLWLLSGFQRRAAWLAAVILFAAFAMYNCFQALGGAQDCGCFGRVEVSPWVTFIFDLAVTLLLLTYPPPPRTDRSRAGRRVGLKFAAGAMTAMVASAMLLSIKSPAAALAASLLNSGSEGAFVLDPSTWVNQPLPIEKHIDSDVDVMHGKWSVMVFGFGCPTCRDKLQQLSQSADAGELTQRWLLIEVPPHAPGREVEKKGIVHVRLSDRIQWRGNIPAQFEMVDGKVVSVLSPQAKR